jgi:hypothetical protein
MDVKKTGPLVSCKLSGLQNRDGNSTDLVCCHGD